MSVACRKSSGSDFRGSLLRVWTHSMDWWPDELVSIAKEVVRQVSDEYTPIKVRFCDWSKDHPEPKCIYCGKLREDAHGYLCAGCLVRPDGGTYSGISVAEQYDMRRHEFTCVPAVGAEGEK